MQPQGVGREGTLPLQFERPFLICPAPGTATTGIDEFVDIPDRHRSRYVTMLVSDGSDDGFVVWGSLRVHEN